MIAEAEDPKAMVRRIFGSGSQKAEEEKNNNLEDERFIMSEKIPEEKDFREILGENRNNSPPFNNYMCNKIEDLNFLENQNKKLPDIDFIKNKGGFKHSHENCQWYEDESMAVLEQLSKFSNMKTPDLAEKLNYAAQLSDEYGMFFAERNEALENSGLLAIPISAEMQTLRMIAEAQDPEGMVKRIFESGSQNNTDKSESKSDAIENFKNTERSLQEAEKELYKLETAYRGDELEPWEYASEMLRSAEKKMLSQLSQHNDNKKALYYDNESINSKIVNKALYYLGSDEWENSLLAINARNIIEKRASFRPKCNEFVYDILQECGIDLGKPIKGHFADHPYLAGDWADKNKEIPGYRVLGLDEVPMAGDIAALKNERWSSSGHCGIVYCDGYTISSSSADNNKGKIILNDWGFRKEQKGKVIFRRKI